jgi:hypothetical protein
MTVLKKEKTRKLFYCSPLNVTYWAAVSNIDFAVHVYTYPSVYVVTCSYLNLSSLSELLPYCTNAFRTSSAHYNLKKTYKSKKLEELCDMDSNPVMENLSPYQTV